MTSIDSAPCRDEACVAEKAQLRLALVDAVRRLRRGKVALEALIRHGDRSQLAGALADVEEAVQ